MKTINIESVTFKTIESDNMSIYRNLASGYEAEFSALSKFLPEPDGSFKPGTLPEAPYQGYLCYVNNLPAGFCIFNVNEEPYDISEFYIVPVFRMQSIGTQLAKYLFDNHPGQWQIRQIEGANRAVAFWRKIIGQFTNQEFKECIQEDSEWGKVIAQHFTMRTRVCP